MFATRAASSVQPTTLAATVIAPPVFTTRAQRGSKTGPTSSCPFPASTFGSPEQVLKYLARYTHRVSISDRRIHGIQGDTVTSGYRDDTSGLQRDMTLDSEGLLRRFLLHVLPQGFVRIRYFGLFANRVRAINVTRCRELLAAAAPDAGDVDSSCAAPGPVSKPEDDRRHRCPACGTGTLRWIATLAPVPAQDAVTRAPTLPDTS